MDYELLMNGNVKIGMKAPEFDAETTMGNISLNDYKGKWLVFFSHPGDFTPVCTTEIIAFSKANTYFEKINTSLLGLSVGAIARKYGMISNDVSTTETVRNVFIIDDKGIVRLILVYPLSVGRCIPEILRCVEALQTADESRGATPANWRPCEKIIKPMPKTFDELIKRNDELMKNKNGMSWYLSYKAPNKCINVQSINKLDEPKKIEFHKEKELKTLNRKDL